MMEEKKERRKRINYESLSSHAHGFNVIPIGVYKDRVLQLNVLSVGLEAATLISYSEGVTNAQLQVCQLIKYHNEQLIKCFPEPKVRWIITHYVVT